MAHNHTSSSQSQNCIVCGGQIEPDRLAVLPGTEKCSTCAHKEPKAAKFRFVNLNPNTEVSSQALGGRSPNLPQYETLRGKISAARPGMCWCSGFSPLSVAGKEAHEDDWAEQYPNVSG